MIDYESLRDATLLVAKLEAAIETKAAPLQAQIAELQKQIDDLVRADRGKLDTAKNLLEQIRLEVADELTKATRARLAALGRGEKCAPLEKPEWLTVVKRERVTITDRDLVPDSFWSIDEKALLKQKAEIPGVRRELVLGLQVLSKKLTEKDTEENES